MKLLINWQLNAWLQKWIKRFPSSTCHPSGPLVRTSTFPSIGGIETTRGSLLNFYRLNQVSEDPFLLSWRKADPEGGQGGFGDGGSSAITSCRWSTCVSYSTPCWVCVCFCLFSEFFVFFPVEPNFCHDPIFFFFPNSRREDEAHHRRRILGQLLPGIQCRNRFILTFSCFYWMIMIFWWQLSSNITSAKRSNRRNCHWCRTLWIRTIFQQINLTSTSKSTQINWNKEEESDEFEFFTPTSTRRTSRVARKTDGWAPRCLDYHNEAFNKKITSITNLEKKK